MPANWGLFESTVSAYWSKPPPNITSEIAAAFITAAYIAATGPAQTSFGNITIVPKPKILYKGFLSMLQQNISSCERGFGTTVQAYIPFAEALVQYWMSIPIYGSSGVLFNPMPPAPPTVAPVPLGAFIKQKDLNDAVADIDKSSPLMKTMSQNIPGGLPAIEKSLKTGAFNLDPLILLASPFCLFSGIPQVLALQLYNAIGVPNSSAADAASKFTTVLKDQMKLISGFYIGFMPPGSVPPLAIVPWSGLT
jgi:hypothetical protein